MLRKIKARVIDNNIFLLSKSQNHDYSIYSIIPINFYSFSKVDVIFHNRNLSCLFLQQKYTKKENSQNSEKFYFKNAEDMDRFVKYFEIPKVALDFFNDYSTIKTIGEGTYSKVYLIRHKLTHEKLAVKIINKNSTNDSLILNEIDVMKFIMSNPHENVVKIYQIFESSYNLYIVMEYLKYNLTELLQLNTFETDTQKVTIIKQISNGVQFLHSNGIIHRDIKSDNIMLTKNFMVKIVDFGFSKVLFENENSNEPFGTLIYSAPEIFMKICYNNKIDIWSLGNLIYQIQNNCLPFDEINSNVSKIANKICKDESILEQIKLSKHKINRIIEGCLIRDPKLRFSIRNVIELVFNV